MKPEEILFKEYDSLRSESQNSMSNRNQILSFGLAAIALIIMGSIADFANTGVQKANLNIAAFNLIVVIPIICALILLMWLGEYERMRRVGIFIANLENQINTIAKKELLSWETKLIETKRHMSYPYYAALILLLLLSVISQFMGNSLIKLTDTQLYLLIASSFIFYVMIIGVIFFRLHKIKKLIPKNKYKVKKND